MFLRLSLKVVMQNVGEHVDVNLGTNFRRRASFTLRQIYPRGKTPCLVHKRFGVLIFGLGVVAMVKVPVIVPHQIATLPTELRSKNVINYPFLSDSLPTDLY
jgi:hypothetical protein